MDAGTGRQPGKGGFDSNELVEGKLDSDCEMDAAMVFRLGFRLRLLAVRTAVSPSMVFEMRCKGNIDPPKLLGRPHRTYLPAWAPSYCR